MISGKRGLAVSIPRRRIRNLKIALLALAFLSSALAHAEIHKEAKICMDTGQICFFYWPKLPATPGWHQDMDYSVHYHMNAQAPDGFDFSNSESVIYAYAEYKEGEALRSSIDEFISFSQNQFIAEIPYQVNIESTGTIRSNGTQVFKSFSFKPLNEGNWEQVSYSEETDPDGNQYFIILVLSSKTKIGYENNIERYLDIVRKYK